MPPVIGVVPVEWIGAVLDHVTAADLCSGAGCSSRSWNLVPLPDHAAQAFITDPPYYGSILYSDLADYFYVWSRQTLGGAFEDLTTDDLVDKADEIIATPTALGRGRAPKDAAFFESAMKAALVEGRRVLEPNRNRGRCVRA